VTLPDGSTEKVTVPAGGETQRTCPAPAEGETVPVSVSSGEHQLASKEFTADCTAGTGPATVTVTKAGVQEVRDQPSASPTVAPTAADLPNTGNPVNAWMPGAGAALVLVGGGVMMLRRRRAN